MSWMWTRTDCICGRKLTVYIMYSRLLAGGSWMWVQDRHDLWVWAQGQRSHSYIESPFSRGVNSSTFMPSCRWRRLRLDWELLCEPLVAKSDLGWTETCWGSSLFSKRWASSPSPSSGMASASPACSVNLLLLSSFSSTTDAKPGLVGELGVDCLGVSGLRVREGMCRNYS